MRRTLLLALVVLAATASPLALRADAEVTASAGGFGDWSCQPSADKPDPIVLLHGLGGDPQQHWSYMGPALAADGYCVFSSPYSAPEDPWPFYGLAPIDAAAADVVAYVDEVLAATGASKVDLVGHSEGGFLSLYVPKVSGLADRVSHVVAMAPPTHGTTFLGLVLIGQLTGTMPYADQFLREGGCGACADLIAGGAAVERLNDGPIAQSGIDYTVIATRTDVLVRHEGMQPATDTAFVREPGVANMYVQDHCPANLAGHIGMAVDSFTLGLVRQALDPTVALPACSYGLPL
jgi:pimeloyl-ACP methyl ester carboxylesterase